MSLQKQSAPRRAAWPVRLLLALLALLLGGALWFAFSHLGVARPAACKQTPPQTARQKTQRRLAEADAKAQEALKARLKTLGAFFRRGQARSKTFAEEALSWSGKWALLQEQLGVGEENAHAKFLQNAFRQHVFAGEDLQKALESTVKGFLIDLEGIESALLVQLRADLADGEGGSQGLPAHLKSDAAFRSEYQRLGEQARRTLETDLQVTAGREVGLFVASDVATQVTLRMARFVAAELGVEAALFGAGAASSVATLGAGLVAAFVLDYLLDAVLKLAGYDPAEEIAQQVSSTVGNVEATLIEGKGGLRQELQTIHQTRAHLRKQIVSKLLDERSE